MQTAQSETGQAYVPRPRTVFSCRALRAFLEERGERGATLTEMYRHFSGNCSAAQLHAALLMLRDVVKTTAHRAKGPNRRAKKPSTFYAIGGQSSDPGAEQRAERLHGTNPSATGIVWKHAEPHLRPSNLAPPKRRPGIDDLAALREFLHDRGRDGATRTEISNLFGHNRTAGQLDALLNDLRVRVQRATRPGAKKPTTIYTLRPRRDIDDAPSGFSVALTACYA